MFSKQDIKCSTRNGAKWNWNWITYWTVDGTKKHLCASTLNLREAIPILPATKRNYEYIQQLLGSNPIAGLWSKNSAGALTQDTCRCPYTGHQEQRLKKQTKFMHFYIKQINIYICIYKYIHIYNCAHIWECVNKSLQFHMNKGLCCPEAMLVFFAVVLHKGI